MALRDYQIELAKQGAKILSEYGIVYYAIQMRVGKSLIFLATANLVQAKNVLVLTPKKAIESIESDYSKFDFNFKLTVTNYEQVPKLKPVYDLIIIDECHNLSAMPKPSLRTKNIKELVGDKKLILSSGTPTPENYSQIYHQLWISDNSPFKEYKNFYKWAHDYVTVKQKLINGYHINDYSHANKEMIESKISHLFVKYTQKEAGFTKEVSDVIFYVPMLKGTMDLVSYLLKTRYYHAKDGSDIVADTAAKLQSKVHQMCSGTVIDEKRGIHIFDRSKIEFIKEKYRGKKIAIFYKYIAESKLIKEAFPDLFDNSADFNNAKEGVYSSQIRSGAMGVNLSTADYIVMYNIDFSAVLYWQARERMQDLNREKECEVHWIFSQGGIEDKIYKAVLKKKDYTTYYFKKDFLCQS